MKESRLRSIAKGITFRILASVLTAATFFVFTGNTTLALGFGAVDFVSKLILYYFHERAWLRIPDKFGFPELARSASAVLIAGLMPLHANHSHEEKWKFHKT